MSSDLDGPDLVRFEDSARTTRQIKAGEHLYRSGDAALSLYAVRSGFIKTSSVTDDGREQVTDFHMLGEIIGLDMIGGGIRANDAVALEDSNICEIALAPLEKLSHDIPSLQRKLYNMIGARFRQERDALLLLGTLRAEDRVASFLLNIGQRYAARGFSALRFVLRMSRAEIGSYLGLRLETVSRLFSRFQAEGLLRVENRFVEIVDPEGLKLVIGRSVN
jgi:CRP/FNR family transcriptional regulator